MIYHIHKEYQTKLKNKKNTKIDLTHLLHPQRILNHQNKVLHLQPHQTINTGLRMQVIMNSKLVKKF